nr:hypothetical protein [Paenibacillus bovis]
MNELNYIETQYFDQIHNLQLPWIPDISTKVSTNVDDKINVRYCDNPISIPNINSLSDFVGINKWKNVSRWVINNENYILTNGFGLMSIDKLNNVKINVPKDKEGWVRIGWMLYNSIGVPIILREKGYLLLHGNLIKKNNKTILILGESGYGKSTLTASMIYYKGWELLSDDIGVVKTTTTGVRAIPGIPIMKLTSHNLNSLFKLTPTNYSSVGYDDYKVYVPSHDIGKDTVKTDYDQNRINLTNIIILKPEKPTEPIVLKQLQPSGSVAVLSHNLYNPWLLQKNELEQQTREICRMLNYDVSVQTLHYPRDINLLEKVCGELDNLV